MGRLRKIWIGQQVMDRGLYSSPYTLRWMKRYISTRSPLKFCAPGRKSLPPLPVKTSLGTLLGVCRPGTGDSRRENCFHCACRMHTSITKTGFHAFSFQIGAPRFRLIDETLGCRSWLWNPHSARARLLILILAAEPWMFPCLIEDDQTRLVGRRCRLLGNSGLAVGGSTLDQWIYQEALSVGGLAPIQQPPRPSATRCSCLTNSQRNTYSNNPGRHLYFKIPNLTQIWNGISREKILNQYWKSTNYLPPFTRPSAMRSMPRMNADFTEDPIS